ncbi:MAG: HAD family phosphatase [Nanoarchaeota archaeon]|nr:HAD family phosphatase [Nanoarchaeota archaeon]MBU4456874.1 HAD family phosphatase [Nanoarchaeota archaeon]
MYKLICFDMDGVIFKDNNFWIELHKRFGTLEQGIKLTEKYLHNNYEKLVEEVVVKLWKGKDAKPYYALVNELEYLPGVKEVFDYVKGKDFITAIISASSIDVARRVQKDFGVDHIFANELVIRDDKITGEFIWPIGNGKEKKAQIIGHLCEDLGISTEEVIYVGDSETDIEAFKEVGLSIAFNSKIEELKEIASHVVNSDNLKDILPCLK